MNRKQSYFENYVKNINEGLKLLAKNPCWNLTLSKFSSTRLAQGTIFLAGNGGSAANANHFATDLIYGANASGKGAFRVHTLPANVSVLTCLANDTGYENAFANQLEVLAKPDDLLIVFSGSGDSPNILRALEVARRLKMFSISFLGFDGGKAKPLSDLSVHFPIHDMQVVEDLHMIAGHLILKAMQ